MNKIKMNNIYLSLFISLLSININAQINQIGSNIDGLTAEEYSGSSLSINSDGSIVAIGAPYNSDNAQTAGQVRIYSNNAGVWTQIGSSINGENKWDNAGVSVSLSSDGSIVAIGTTGDDGNGNLAGNVRIFKNTNGTWTQMGSNINGEASEDRSGSSVSLSSDGSIVAIGATHNDGSGTNAGHVRIYKNEAGEWIQMGSDIDGEAADDQSGSAISLSADGLTVAIGSRWNDGYTTDAGHVRVYKNTGSVWVQIGSDIDGEGYQDQSGTSVSLSSDGSTVAIGAPFNKGIGWWDVGHVRVYKNNAGSWIQKGQDIEGNTPLDQSGVSASLNADGSVLAIGARSNNSKGAGYVKIYKYDTGAWTQEGSDINGEADSDQPLSISLSSSGSVVAIGTPHHQGNGSNAGYVRVYSISSLVTGIDQEEEINSTIFPNPTSEIVTINLRNSQHALISITNIEGKEIYHSNNLLKKTLSISLAEFNTGIYFVKIQSKNKQKVVKLIKL